MNLGRGKLLEAAGGCVNMESPSHPDQSFDSGGFVPKDCSCQAIRSLPETVTN